MSGLLSLIFLLAGAVISSQVQFKPEIPQTPTSTTKQQSSTVPQKKRQRRRPARTRKVQTNTPRSDSTELPPSPVKTAMPTPSPRPVQKRRPYNPEEHPPEKSATPQNVEAQFTCISADVDLDSPVLLETTESGKRGTAKKVTVRTRLVQLQARCEQGRIVDGKGKQIYIYSLIGCWGNPPEDYLDLLSRQAAEIEQLKKKYTVVQIPCGGGDPRLIN